MTSSSHYWGCAQSVRTPCAGSTALLPAESRFNKATLPLQLSAKPQNCLEVLKDSVGSLFGTRHLEATSGVRNSAQILRTPRTAGKRLLSPESGFRVVLRPLQLCARAQNALEALTSNLVAPFAPFDATYHSIGWEGVSTVAHIARRVPVSPESGSRSSTRVSFARCRVATTHPDITMNS